MSKIFNSSSKQKELLEHLETWRSHKFSYNSGRTDGLSSRPVSLLEVLVEAISYYSDPGFNEKSIFGKKRKGVTGRNKLATAIGLTFTGPRVSRTNLVQRLQEIREVVRHSATAAIPGAGTAAAPVPAAAVPAVAPPPPAADGAGTALAAAVAAVAEEAVAAVAKAAVAAVAAAEAAPVTAAEAKAPPPPTPQLDSADIFQKYKSIKHLQRLQRLQRLQLLEKELRAKIDKIKVEISNLDPLINSLHWGNIKERFLEVYIPSGFLGIATWTDANEPPSLQALAYHLVENHKLNTSSPTRSQKAFCELTGISIRRDSGHTAAEVITAFENYASQHKTNAVLELETIKQKYKDYINSDSERLANIQKEINGNNSGLVGNSAQIGLCNRSGPVDTVENLIFEKARSESGYLYGSFFDMVLEGDRAASDLFNRVSAVGTVENLIFEKALSEPDSLYCYFFDKVLAGDPAASYLFNRVSAVGTVENLIFEKALSEPDSLYCYFFDRVLAGDPAASGLFNRVSAVGTVEKLLFEKALSEPDSLYGIFFDRVLAGDPAASGLFERVSAVGSWKHEFFKRVLAESGSLEAKFFSEVLKGDTCEWNFFSTSTNARKFLEDPSYHPLFEKYVENKIERKNDHNRGADLVLDNKLVEDYGEYLLHPDEITIQGSQVKKGGFRLRNHQNKKGAMKKRDGDVRVVPIYYYQNAQGERKELGLKRNGSSNLGNIRYWDYSVFDYDRKLNNSKKKAKMLKEGPVVTNIGTHATRHVVNLMFNGVDISKLNRDKYKVSTAPDKMDAFYMAYICTIDPRLNGSYEKERDLKYKPIGAYAGASVNREYGDCTCTFKCRANPKDVYVHNEKDGEWTRGLAPGGKFKPHHQQAVFFAHSNYGDQFLVARCGKSDACLPELCRLNVKMTRAEYDDEVAKEEAVRCAFLASNPGLKF